MYGPGNGMLPAILPNTSSNSLLLGVSVFTAVVGVLIVATTIARLVAKRHYKG
jgi:hypothetical protein